MKTMITLLTLILLIISSNAFAAKAEKILDCHEKFSDFTITKNGDPDDVEGTYRFSRFLLTYRAKGNPYLAGTLDTESGGLLYAEKVTKTKEALIFTLKNKKTLTIRFDKSENNSIKLKLESNDDFILTEFKGLLNTEENELSFR